MMSQTVAAPPNHFFSLSRFTLRLERAQQFSKDHKPLMIAIALGTTTLLATVAKTFSTNIANQPTASSTISGSILSIPTQATNHFLSSTAKFSLCCLLAGVAYGIARYAFIRSRQNRAAQAPGAPSLAPPPPAPPPPSRISSTTGRILTGPPAARSSATRAGRPPAAPVVARRAPHHTPSEGQPSLDPATILEQRAAILAHRTPSTRLASPAAGRPPPPTSRPLATHRTPTPAATPGRQASASRSRQAPRAGTPTHRPLATPWRRPPAATPGRQAPASQSRRAPPAGGLSAPPTRAARPPAPPIRAAKPLPTPTPQSAPQGARPLPTPPTRATTSAARPPAPPIRAAKPLPTPTPRSSPSAARLEAPPTKPLPTPTPRSTPSAARSPAPPTRATPLPTPPSRAATPAVRPPAPSATEQADPPLTTAQAPKPVEAAGASPRKSTGLGAMIKRSQAKGARQRKKSDHRPFNERHGKKDPEPPTDSPRVVVGSSGEKGKSFQDLAGLVRDDDKLEGALNKLAPVDIGEETAFPSDSSSPQPEGEGGVDEFGDLASLATGVDIGHIPAGGLSGEEI